MAESCTSLGFPNLLWWVLGLWVGFKILRMVLLCNVLVRPRYQPPHYQPLNREVPPHIQQGLHLPIQELQALGFEWRGWLEVRRIVASSADRVIQACLHHPGTNSFAFVAFSDVPDPLNLFNVVLDTYLDNGRTVTTVNGLAHSLVGRYPDTDLVDACAPTLAGQWNAHLEALKKIPGGVHSLALDLDQVVDRENAAIGRHMELLVQDGTMVPVVGMSRLEMTWSGAFKIARKMVAGMGRVQGMLQQRVKALRDAGQEEPQPPVEEEAAAYVRQEELLKTPSRRHGYLWLFLGTLVLFALTVMRVIDLPSTLMLLVALMFHEFGHFACMRLFGYQDTTIFFIPFFGAVATGYKKETTLSQEMVILLAGPVPGLLLAGALLLWGPQKGDWLHGALIMLVTLNAFNLLPFVPLDGGRVVQQLLFTRNAYADLLFRVLAIGGFVALGVGLDSVTMLVLAGLMCLRLRPEFRTVGLRKRFQTARLQDGDAADDVVLMFNLLRSMGHARLPFVQKVAMVRGVLGHQVRHPRAGCLVVLIWLVAYLAAVGLAVACIVGLVWKVQAGMLNEQGPIPVPEMRVPLSCPARPIEPSVEDLHQQADAPVERRVPFSRLVAVFPDASALPQARKVVESTRWPEEVVRISMVELGSVLVVHVMQKPSERYSGSDPDVDEAVKEARAQEWLQEYQRRRQVRTELIRQRVKELELLGGQVFPEGMGGVSLECQVSDESAAIALHKELELYFSVPPFMDLRPPWVRSGQKPSMAAQEALARETYLALQRASLQDGDVDVVMTMMRAMSAGCTDQVSREDAMKEVLEEARKRRARAAREAAERHEREGPWDGELASMFLLDLEGEGWSPDRSREMAERMGRLDHGSEPGGGRYQVSGQVSRNGRSIRITPHQLGGTRDAVDALMSWMCQRGCSDWSVITANRAEPPEWDEE